MSNKGIRYSAILYLIPLLLWLVLIHVELRNCPVPGTKTFGLLPLFTTGRLNAVALAKA